MPAMPRETRHFPLVAVATLAFAFAGAFAGPALAKDPGDEAYMMRMMACAGEGVSMEVYLPQSVVFGKKPLQQTLAQPVIGYYILWKTQVIGLLGVTAQKPLCRSHYSKLPRITAFRR
jgi:hypothetical protein